MHLFSGAEKRVRNWLSGFATEMRKKSPATLQKWVDSIAVDESESTNERETYEEKNSNCDINEATTSGENLKVKLNEICSKLSAKGKKIEFKNLLKLKLKNSMEQTNDNGKENLEEQVQSCDENVESCNQNVSSSTMNLENQNHLIPSSLKPVLNHEEFRQSQSDIDENQPPINPTVQRCPLSVLGRSSSENPPRNRRLNDIGRSFSVSDKNDIEINSSENLIYDADEEISITIPMQNQSSSIITNKTNQSLSNSQMMPGRQTMRPAREHTVSEGHQSPLVQPRNPLLRDSSFQVSAKNDRESSARNFCFLFLVRFKSSFKRRVAFRSKKTRRRSNFD